MRLTDPWTLGGLPVPNRVVLAPLAGIGNWFVRLQAKRYGAGMVVSEMVSSHAVHYGNERTLRELLRIDPREREPVPTRPGPIAIQLFGHDPDVMRSAAATVAAAGADLIDLNMGCPVPKVMKTGAGAALPRDPARAVAIARAAAEGSGLPVTVKLRAEGVPAARALVEDGCVAGITFHPRGVKVRHAGVPDYELAARLVAELDVPVIVSGGMAGADHIRWVFEHTGCAAVMLARGALGNPWLFEEVLGTRTGAPDAAEIVAEWLWVLDRAVEHLGAERAGSYLKKFHPWYVERLGAGRETQNSLQRAGSVTEQKALIQSLAPVLSSSAA
ncbi:MAG: tRNA-dihydrouridine synthase [Solirubrobacteraceae bacterium]|nr:tRNA-dihydrouridine synthase [Solirubrobacteraceae bacterium]